MLTITVDEELRTICRDLLAEGWSESEWALREADDWIQSDRYEGGFDADESAFIFSHYAESGELWFQFTLEEAKTIADGSLLELPARPAE
jgi:hypothetical protein